MIYHFHQGLHSIKLWRKMFENNPKTIFDRMAVVNKHADMEDTERAHRHHKDRCNPIDCPRQREDDSVCTDGDRPPRLCKNRDRTKSSKACECKHGPDNTVAIADQPQQRTSLNQE